MVIRLRSISLASNGNERSKTGRIKQWITKGSSSGVTVTNRTHWQYRLYTDLNGCNENDQAEIIITCGIEIRSYSTTEVSSRFQVVINLQQTSSPHPSQMVSLARCGS